MLDDGDRTPPDGSVGAGAATMGGLDDCERELASSSAWARAATGVRRVHVAQRLCWGGSSGEARRRTHITWRCGRGRKSGDGGVR